MKKIAIVGALWTPNFGDVLLVKLLKEQIESLGHEVGLLNSHEKIRRELNVSNSINLKDYDCLLFCGGGYFSEPPGNSYKWALSRYMLLFKYATMCKLNNIPYYVLGVGAGPINSILARLIIKHVCNNAQLVALRDRESINAISDLKTKTTLVEVADYVLSMRDKISLSKKHGDKFNIGAHITVNGKKNIKGILSYLQTRKNGQSVNIFFIEDHPGEFERLSLLYPEIKDIFSNNVLKYSNVDTFVSDINKLDYVITSKLHVGIVAAVLEKRICSLPYHAKVERLYHSFGRDDLCLTDMSCDKSIFNHLEYCEKSDEVVIPELFKDKSRKIDALVKEILSND